MAGSEKTGYENASDHLLENAYYMITPTPFSRKEDVDELVELITETLCAVRPTIRVGGENMPAEQVKARFLTLNSEHIGYVLDSMARNSADIRNIRAYLLTVLYHAPVTINSHYQAEVRRDWNNC